MPRALVTWLCVGAIGCAAAAPQSSAPAAAVARPTTADAKRAMLAAAIRATAAHNDAQALALLAALCPVDPEMEDYCLHYQALAHAHAGDSTAAAALWARLDATHPQSVFAARAALERGRLMRTGGDLSGARALLESARTSGDEGVELEARLELAEVDVAAGSPSAAEANLLEVRTRAPGTPLGRTAKQRTEQLRAAYPELAPQGSALAAELPLLISEGDFDTAQAAADRLLTSATPSERPDLLRLRATAELGAHQTDAGLATLQQIVRESPDAAAAPEAQFRYATVLWNRDRDAEAEQAFADFRRRYPGDSHMPDTLYALGRIAQGDGRSDQAAALYAELAGSYPSSSLAHEARWRIGWIRYQEGRWRDAAALFEQVPPPANSGDNSDAEYWRARSLERAGDSAGAARLYRLIITEAPGSYYARWAAQRVGQAPLGAGTVPARRPKAIGSPPPGSDPYHWSRAVELQGAGLPRMSLAELRAFEHANAAGDAASLLAAYQAIDGYRDAIRLARARGVSDPEVLYPLAFWPDVTRHTAGSGLDPLLVLAVMRQESMFDPDARSPADARGLMQLLPSTAERTARQLGQQPPSGRLNDPDTNIGLGVAHLQQLLAAHPGEPMKALAAYNGGEEAVARWERRFGGVETDEFVESITYRETRDYVKKVVGNYQRYQQTYRH